MKVITVIFLLFALTACSSTSLSRAYNERMKTAHFQNCHLADCHTGTVAEFGDLSLLKRVYLSLVFPFW